MNWNKLVMAGFAIMLCMLTTIACKQTQKEDQIKAPTTAQLDVSFNVIPEQPVPNMTPTLQTTVTQNNKAITNARVDLEVWKDGTEKHQMIKATHSQDGNYTVDCPLQDEGNYKVAVHVSTPNGMEKKINGTFTVKKKEML